jgi:glycyl-tRNA synthetase beta chain
MSDLLVEVGTAELPPSELPDVLAKLDDGVGKFLRDLRLPFGSVQTFATPRRLAIAVTDLADVQTSATTVVTGPPVKAGFDASGAPTKAAEGFARAQGVSVAALTRVTTERGEYLAVERAEPSQPAAAILPDALARFIIALPFVKKMRWGDGDIRFVRPIRWLVALLDDAVLPLQIGDVVAGRTTYGHRFLGGQKAIELATADADAYTAALEAAGVIADVERRRAQVLAECRKVVPAPNRVVEDEATLRATVHLVEMPFGIVGRFPEQYLALPREVVQIPIQHHQRWLTVETPDGALAPMFVATSNVPDTRGAIRSGYERVIRARLADADFYFRSDLRMKPEERVSLLGGIVFQERLGTLREKTDRLVALVATLADATGVDAGTVRRAAFLAKSDLASGVVREFPELQGVIGGHYARLAGEPPAVARAIAEQYLPRSADDRVPDSIEGAVLGIADRVDSVVGCLGVGLLPRGSEDPYALRRQAQAVVQIAILKRVALDLPAVVSRALELLAPKLTESPDITRTRVLDLFRTRIESVLAAQGYRRDVVEAVVTSGADDPANAAARAAAITACMERGDWDAVVIAFKRVINILPEHPRDDPDPRLFVDEAERRLYEAINAQQPLFMRAVASGDYAEAFATIAALRPGIDAFFAAVLVMASDAAIRDNRLALLGRIGRPMLKLADLRKIQVLE